jgi:hypothetical protein
MEYTAPTHNVIDCSIGEVRAASDINMENQIGGLLTQHYPHVSWFVESNCDTGIVTVELPEFHRDGNQNFGFVLHLDKLKGWDDMKKSAIWAGGELLERAHISRTHQIRYADKVDRN